jgi:hypothetical protein
MSLRFDDFTRNLYLEKCIKNGGLVQIPGTDISEYLFEFCDNATAINNYCTANEWANDFGARFPKFVLVAYSMVMFKCFDILKKMIYGRYDEYDVILSGLWSHYIGIPCKSSQQIISSIST